MDTQLDLAERSAVIQWLAISESHDRWLAFFDWLDTADKNARTQFHEHCAALNGTPLLTDLQDTANALKLTALETATMCLTLYAWLATGVSNHNLRAFVEAQPVINALDVEDHSAQELIIAALNMLMDQAATDENDCTFILVYVYNHPELAGEESNYMVGMCSDMLVQGEAHSRNLMALIQLTDAVDDANNRQLAWKLLKTRFQSKHDDAPTPKQLFELADALDEEDPLGVEILMFLNMETAVQTDTCADPA